MSSPLPYLLSLSSLADKAGHRYLVRLVGSEQWQTELLESFITQHRYSKCTKLGGAPVTGAAQLSYKQGAQLLGREQQCLIYDAIDGFDANSFSAASGALCGGGLLFLNLPPNDSFSYQWLNMRLEKEIVIEQDAQLPSLPQLSALSLSSKRSHSFEEQNEAITLIEKVFTGHRKRPLILTADRGRGKTTALGIAAANLINSRKKVRILVTAPSRKAVQPLFEHAAQSLNLIGHYDKNEITSGDCYIRYISPDELLRSKPESDLILVDEASAIPISLLIKLISHYHRMVFATTIHGYEGCGRGFTLKFIEWLNEHRAGWKQYHIHQAVRWNENDPLESWIFSTFLLNVEPENHHQAVNKSELTFRAVSQQELVFSPALLCQCFALLVNAHYQTSPNDLLQLLDDGSQRLFVLMDGDKLVGCLIGIEEGNLPDSLIEDIEHGRRRPRGHLTPVILAGQLGISQAAAGVSLRIMRIAVAPQYQRSGFGCLIISYIEQLKEKYTYLSTSYGVTRELLAFWLHCGFRTVRLGTSRDQASGCHSLLMVKALKPQSWLRDAERHFSCDLLSLLPETFNSLEADLVICLLKTTELIPLPLSSSQQRLISIYLQGGSSYENAAYSLTQLVLESRSDKELSPILISKLLQKCSWSEIAVRYSLKGRKESEQLFRNAINSIWEFTV